MVIAWVLVWNEKRKVVPWSLAVLAFAFFQIVAALRINPVENDFHEYVTSTTILQILYSTAVLIISWLTLPKFPPKTIAIALLVTITVPIWTIVKYRIPLMISPVPDYSVGEFFYGSYQWFGFLYGIYFFVNLYFFQTWKGVMRLPPLLNIGIVVYLSLFSAGRGEAAALCIAFALSFAPLKSIYFTPIVGYGAYWAVMNLDYRIFERWRLVLDGNSFGLRDQLWPKAYEYWTSSLETFFFGGGANAFQQHWHLTQSFYPHNVLLEAATTGGLPHLIVALGLMVIPLIYITIMKIQNNTPWNRFVFAIAIFNLLVIIKSGTLLSMQTYFLFLPVAILSTMNNIKNKSQESESIHGDVAQQTPAAT